MLAAITISPELPWQTWRNKNYWSLVENKPREGKCIRLFKNSFSGTWQLDQNTYNPPPKKHKHTIVT